MRFTEQGCDIPDELILAREAGQVVFFCGAGVSKNSGLPDFWQLADSVFNKLRPTPNSPARLFLEKAKMLIATHPELNAIATADQLFTLLEQEFSVEYIEQAVVASLKPQNNVDLTAHETILKLATTKKAHIQLVTTNFDRLFEQVDPNITSWIGPNLPDLNKNPDLNGIIYLHGRSTKKYDSHDKHELILNTADFGHAYIAAGWASQFFKHIVKHYHVVFIGYSADDPPINYLLRALKKYKGPVKGLYAFDAGAEDQVKNKWHHKSVTAIPFPAGDFDCLWSSLRLWANFACDPEAWQAQLFQSAKNGPKTLKPFQRNQVAFLTKSEDGVKAILDSKPLLPAHWLCVFDRSRRFAALPHYNQNKSPTPFECYGLDIDPSPPAKDAEHSQEKETKPPPSSWHAFDFITADADFVAHQAHANNNDGIIYSQQPLPPRLRKLGWWITRQLDDPITLWWASNQKQPLHQQIQDFIKRQLINSGSKTISKPIRDGWRLLLQVWANHPHQAETEFYHLIQQIKQQGWSNLAVTQYADCLKPTLQVEHYGNGFPPNNDIAYCPPFTVAFTTTKQRLDIPNEWLIPMITKLRENIILAIDLASLLPTPEGLANQIKWPQSHEQAFTNYSNGINALLHPLIALFDRLKSFDSNKAKLEYMVWSTINHDIFYLLRLWAAKDHTFLLATEFAALINHQLPQHLLWHDSLSQQVFIAIKARWHDISEVEQQQFTQQLLEGPIRREWQQKERWLEMSAADILTRIQLMQNNNCILDVSNELIQSLKIQSPRWTPAWVDGFTEFNDCRVYSINKIEDCHVLADLPASKILETAKNESGRTEDRTIERVPFVGLCKKQPIKILRALRLATRNGNFATWYWNEFLSSESRQQDSAKLQSLIARHLIRLTPQHCGHFLHKIVRWYEGQSKSLFAYDPEAHKQLLVHIYQCIAQLPVEAPLNHAKKLYESSVNHPISVFANTIIFSPDTQDKFLNNYQLDVLTKLLNLPDDAGRYALIKCTVNLNWFFHHSPSWCQQNLFSFLDKKRIDMHVFWCGLLGASSIPSPVLFKPIKFSFLSILQQPNTLNTDFVDSLVQYCLLMWASTVGCYLSNEEYSEILVFNSDTFRQYTIRQLQIYLDGEDSKKWNSKAKELFTDVWPKQQIAQTKATTNALCDFLFHLKADYQAFVTLVFPHLLPDTKPDYLLPIGHYGDEDNNSLLTYPSETLKILAKVLPVNPGDCPDEINCYLIQLAEKTPSIINTQNFIELQNRLRRKS